MNPDLSFLSPLELLTLRLRGIYDRAGYRRFTADGFEPYDIYSRNRGFLDGGGIITVPGYRGRLMALRPDVTMSIINNLPADSGPRRLYYCEKVFRAESGGECRDISQAGLEFIGGADVSAEAEVISLALRSLEAIGGGFMLEVGHNGFSAGYLENLGCTPRQTARALDALSRRSRPEIMALEAETGGGLSRLAELSGPFPETLKRAEELAVTDSMRAALQGLHRLWALLEGCERRDNLRLDFSVSGVMDYYNGLIFKGYLGGAPTAVLSGGRYDGLMRRFGKPQPALGFALYLGEIDRALSGPSAEGAGDGFLTVALPKGRLGDSVYELMAAAGRECPAILKDSRALVFENPEKRTRYLLVKPSDVQAYVERGAADIGVVGSDVLRESGADVYELLDLRLGVCRMVCAARAGFVEDPELPLRVATKYPVTAAAWFEDKSRRVDIIKLHGSIELAPCVGLSDVIVDITETGGTLRENGLVILEDLAPISARLIANRAAYKFKRETIDGLAAELEALI